MAYGDFKDLNRRTFADKLLCEKHLILLKIQNMMDINMDFLQPFVNVLIKKTSGRDLKSIPNKKLAEELYKPVIRKFN